MKNNFFNIAIGLLAFGTTGCSDFLNEYSQDLVTAKTVTDLNELLIGDVYLRSHTVERGMSAGTMAFVNMLDDDINTTGTDASKGNVGDLAWNRVVSPMYGFFTWQQDVRYNFTRTVTQDDATTWNTLYTRINHANNIIDIIDDMPRNTDEEKMMYHRVKGEAHFARAQFYFALANLYGKPYDPDSAAVTLNVPLKLTSHVEHDKDKDTQFERASAAAVYESIVSDLRIAEEQLTISPQNPRFRLHRASAEAAALLLSRTLLYMQRWEEAEAAAKRVIESKNFTLSGTSDFQLNVPFLTPANREVIFSQGANNVAAENTRTSLSGNPGDYCVSRELYDLYEDGDMRKVAFFSVNAQSDSIRFMQKYERGLKLNHISDAFLLRLSEAYLNHAEACSMQPGKETDANQSMKTLRTQRIPYYTHTDLTGEELVNEVRNERRRELCFEGHRWFDLRRYAVNKRQPLAKNVVHVFNAFSESNSFLSSHLYVLPAGDPSFTFAIPKSVVEFDKIPMADNLREKRSEIKPDPVPPVFPEDEEENGDNNSDSSDQS